MSESAHRLPGDAGLLIDRAKSIGFSFEGQSYRGYEGDTIASALAANGVKVLSRSFKYHRPRGILTMAGQDANTLVQLPHEPNVLADRHPIAEGLEVMGQNYSGSLVRDRNAAMAILARFMPVGFYYRSLFRPGRIWEWFWEPLVRRSAGLGKVRLDTAHGYHDKAYAFCDVAVVGAGPAGMAAALSAAVAGAKVWLIEENPVLGGALSYGRFDMEGLRADALRAEMIAAVEAEANIEVKTNAVCNGWFADNWLPVIQGRRLYKFRAKEMVLAAGCMEQPAQFRNNDLPGTLVFVRHIFHFKISIKVSTR